MTVVASLLVVAFAATLFAGLIRVLGPDPVAPYVPRHAAAVTARMPGATLDPVTLAMPPAECGLADDVLERIVAGLRRPSTDVVLADRPTGASGKRHDPDWRFRTDEWEIARVSFFAGQPENRAVAKEWAGTGLVAA